MIYRLIEASNVIANVQDSFNIEESDWIGRAANWINKGLTDLGVISELAVIHKETEFTDFRVELPCDIRAFEALEINGQRIQRSNNVTLTGNIDTVITYAVQGNNYLTLETENENFRNVECILHYKNFPTAKFQPYGILLPLVPDLDVVQEALSMYILIKLLGRGYTHKVFNLRDQSPATNPYFAYNGIPGKAGLKQRAKNAIKHMDKDAREQVSQSIRSFNHPDRHQTLDFNKQY